MRRERLTKAESIAIVRHKLFVGHNNSDGADNVHGPCSHIRYCRRFLFAFHLRSGEWWNGNRFTDTRSTQASPKPQICKCTVAQVRFSEFNFKFNLNLSDYAQLGWTKILSEEKKWKAGEDRFALPLWWLQLCLFPPTTLPSCLVLHMIVS